MRKEAKNRKGVSPVIATVLLITIVIILGVIIFLWARGFINEKAEKFGGAVELSCEQIEFEAGIFDCPNCILEVVNRGNVPIYGFDVKERNTGEVIVHEILDGTVTVGESHTFPPLPSSVGSGDLINVVPIILGETTSGNVAHTCDDQFGYAIQL